MPFWNRGWAPLCLATPVPCPLEDTPCIYPVTPKILYLPITCLCLRVHVHWGFVPTQAFENLSHKILLYSTNKQAPDLSQPLKIPRFLRPSQWDVIEDLWKWKETLRPYWKCIDVRSGWFPFFCWDSFVSNCWLDEKVTFSRRVSVSKFSTEHYQNNFVLIGMKCFVLIFIILTFILHRKSWVAHIEMKCFNPSETKSHFDFSRINFGTFLMQETLKFPMERGFWFATSSLYEN